MEENTRNNPVNSRVGEEGEIVATGTGVDIPLQPMERNVSKQILTSHPVGAHSGTGLSSRTVAHREDQHWITEEVLGGRSSTEKL